MKNIDLWTLLEECVDKKLFWFEDCEIRELQDSILDQIKKSRNAFIVAKKVGLGL